MPKVGLYKMDGNKVGDIELNEAVFGQEVNRLSLTILQIKDRARRAPKLVQRFRAAVSNRGVRKVQAVQDRAVSGLHSGLRAVSH